MSDHVSTEEQIAINEFIKGGNGHLLIDALAGTGKTYTLLSSLVSLPQKSALMCAFNKPIAEELTAKMGKPPAGSMWKAATFHSLGLKIVMAHRPRLDIRKEASEDLINEAASEWEAASLTRSSTKIQRVSFPTRRAAVQLLRTVKDTYTERDLPHDVALVTAELHNAFGKLNDDEKAIAVEIVQRAYVAGQDLKSRSAIDFCDMTWLPVVLDLTPPSRYQVVFVDEAQDLSLAQLKLVKKLVAPKGRLVVVGDLHQCHPAGTLVEITGGRRAPIEDVRVEDQVVSYHDCFRGIASQGRKVTGTARRMYSGPLITIEAGSERVRVTSEHRLPTRFRDDGKMRWALYLMEYGKSSRLGCCQLFYSNAFGPAMRARHEGASRLWVLDVFTDEDEAKLAETAISIKFGISEHIFKEKGELKKKLLKVIGDNRDRTDRCLRFFNRLYDFPMYERGEGKHFARSYSYVTQACNLFDGINEVRTFDGTRDGGSWATVKLSREDFRGYVYSLSVEATEGGLKLYVADRILVHNSIYKWRGAVGQEVWKEMRETFKATQLPLTMTFRCSQAVVKQANEIVPALKPKPGAPAGSVTNCQFEQLAKKLRDAWNVPTFVLSRNNNDLLHTALFLWKHDIGFQMLAGREIVEPLYEIIDKLDKSTKARFNASLTTWYQVEMKKAESIHASAWADRVEQQYNSLLLLQGYAEPSKFKQILQDLINIGGMSAITLSTVHKVKGLEAERVYLLKQTFSRHRYRQQIEEAHDDWERNRARERLANIDPEELHLEYVAVTRAKLDLIWVDMRGASAETLAKLADVGKKK